MSRRARGGPVLGQLDLLDQVVPLVHPAVAEEQHQQGDESGGTDHHAAQSPIEQGDGHGVVPLVEAGEGAVVRAFGGVILLFLRAGDSRMGRDLGPVQGGFGGGTGPGGGGGPGPGGSCGLWGGRGFLQPAQRGVLGGVRLGSGLLIPGFLGGLGVFRGIGIFRLGGGLLLPAGLLGGGGLGRLGVGGVGGFEGGVLRLGVRVGFRLLVRGIFLVAGVLPGRAFPFGVGGGGLSGQGRRGGEGPEKQQQAQQACEYAVFLAHGVPPAKSRDLSNWEYHYFSINSRGIQREFVCGQTGQENSSAEGRSGILRKGDSPSLCIRTDSPLGEG